MKRFLTTIFVIVCVQTFCYALNENIPDSTKIEYQVHGNDTLVIEKIEYMFVSGFKQYIDDKPTDYKNADYDIIEYAGYEYMKKNVAAMTKDILGGYGKKRCKEMFALSSKSEKSLKLYVRIRVDLNGVITCVKFMYPNTYAPFMTYEDIKRNTEIILNRPSDPYPRLDEFGIELSPWITFSITSSILQRYLEKCVDFKYDEETVRFDVRLDTTVIAYIKEQYEDTVKLDGKIVSAEYDSVVKEYLQNEDVVVAVDSVQKIALHHFKRVPFVEGKDVCIRLDINETGEVVRCNFVFPSEYSDGVWPEHILELTKQIKESIMFTSPGRYGRNTISIDIPVNGLLYK